MEPVMTTRKKRFIVATTPYNKYNVGEKPVANGLALTPSDIERLAARGIAVSTPAANQFSYDDDGSATFEIRPELRKDADRNSLWELSRQSRNKIGAAYKRDKERFS